MTSEVSICNLALSFLGETASISSLEPPEGSAEAGHCAVLYPYARDGLLQSHQWSFATRRERLALLGEGSGFGFREWKFAYAFPTDALRVFSVSGENTEKAGNFVCALGSGSLKIILAQDEQAVASLVVRVTDVMLFSPLFVTTFAWRLASFLAGPLLKGDVGAAEAKRCEAFAQSFLSQAVTLDSGQEFVTSSFRAEWLRARL